MKHLNQRIGSVQKISHTFDGLQLSISNAHVAIMLYAPNIVRVCISKQPLSTVVFVVGIVGYLPVWIGI